MEDNRMTVTRRVQLLCVGVTMLGALVLELSSPHAAYAATTCGEETVCTGTTDLETCEEMGAGYLACAENTPPGCQLEKAVCLGNLGTCGNLIVALCTYDTP